MFTTPLPNRPLFASLFTNPLFSTLMLRTWCHWGGRRRILRNAGALSQCAREIAILNQHRFVNPFHDKGTTYYIPEVA